MKSKSLRQHGSVAAILIATGTGSALAHDQTGSVGPSGTGMVDVYSVSCFADPDLGNQNTGRLNFHIRDNATAPENAAKLTVTACKWPGMTPCVTSTDFTDTDALFSATALATPLAGQGNGTYIMTVTRNNGSASGTGAESYQIEYHCETTGGVHTGSGIEQLQ